MCFPLSSLEIGEDVMNTTARPWVVFGNYICKMNEGHHPVYVTGQTPGCTANWEANAALIVRAVNTFDEVKAVLRQADKVLADDKYPPFSPTRTAIREVLAKMEGR